jgi:hypothetical protein
MFSRFCQDHHARAEATLREHWRNLICPDCGARADRDRLRHHLGCPIGDGYVLVLSTDNVAVRFKDLSHAYLVEDPDQPVTDWSEFTPAPDLGDPCDICAEPIETPAAIADGICGSCQRAFGGPARPNKRRRHA